MPIRTLPKIPPFSFISSYVNMLNYNILMASRKLSLRIRNFTDKNKVQTQRIRVYLRAKKRCSKQQPSCIVTTKGKEKVDTAPNTTSQRTKEVQTARVAEGTTPLEIKPKEQKESAEEESEGSSSEWVPTSPETHDDEEEEEDDEEEDRSSDIGPPVSHKRKFDKPHPYLKRKLPMRYIS